MSKLSLGLESLVPEKISLKGMSSEMMCEISLEAMMIDNEITASMEELTNLCNQAVNINAMIDSLEQHGISDQMIELCGLSDITKIQYPKITNANRKQYTTQSVEALADVFDKISVVIETAVRSFGDKISNFIKTLLPFKERYYRKLTDALRANQFTAKVDEEKFGKSKGYGPAKSNWNAWTGTGLKELTRLAQQFKTDPIKAVSDLETFYRTLGFRKGKISGAPIITEIYTLMDKNTFSALGYKSSDVKKIAKDAVDGFDELERTLRSLANVVMDHVFLDRAVGHALARRDNESATAMRNQVSEFAVKYRKFVVTYQMFSIGYRRIMIFATRMVNAYNDSIVY